MQSLEDFIRVMDLPMPFTDDTSYALVRIEPVDGPYPWEKARTEWGSKYIARRVFESAPVRRCCGRPRSMVGLERAIGVLLQSPDAGARRYGAALFEQAVHSRFRAGIWLRPEGITEGVLQLDINIRGDGEEGEGESGEGWFYTLPVRAGEGGVESRYLRRYLCLAEISGTGMREPGSVDAVWMSEDAVVFFRIHGAHSGGGGGGLSGPGVEQLVNELPAWLRESVHVVFVVPTDNGSTTTQKFGWREDSYPRLEVGEPEVGEYPQYVYYFDLGKAG